MSGCVTIPSSNFVRGSKASCVVVESDRNLKNVCKQNVYVAQCYAAGILRDWNDCSEQTIWKWADLGPGERHPIASSAEWIVVCGKGNMDYGGFNNAEAFCTDGGPVIAKEAPRHQQTEEEIEEDRQNFAEVTGAILGGLAAIQASKNSRSSSSGGSSYQAPYVPPTSNSYAGPSTKSRSSNSSSNGYTPGLLAQPTIIRNDGTDPPTANSSNTTCPSAPTLQGNKAQVIAYVSCRCSVAYNGQTQIVDHGAKCIDRNHGYIFGCYLRENSPPACDQR